VTDQNVNDEERLARRYGCIHPLHTDAYLASPKEEAARPTAEGEGEGGPAGEQEAAQERRGVANLVSLFERMARRLS
jgi:hypothetical protein